MINTVPIAAGKPPAVGFGLWKLAKSDAADVVYQAIKTGYRSLDSACDYGNEKETGEGISRAISDGIVKREDLFITSKLWNTFHRKEHVAPALSRTLSDLGVDYLDLYLIHFPISLKYVPFEKRYPPEWVHDPSDPELNSLVMDNEAPLHETWCALEDEVAAGRVRAIGVCNYTVPMLMELLKYSKIKPAALQVEIHPYLAQTKLLEFAKRNNISVTAFSPLGASSYKELDMDKGFGKGALGEPVVNKIAERLGRTPAQVILRWGVQRGCSVIPKTSRIQRLSENLNIFDFELAEEDMNAIGALNRNVRFNDPGEFCKGMGFSIPIYD